MSYLPPSSLYLRDPEPHPLPQPDLHPEASADAAPEAHIEPLRLAAKTPAPSAPPQMYVTPPPVPHTVERVIEHVPQHAPPEPPHVSLDPKPHVERRYPEPTPHVQHASTEPQVVERIIERVVERPPETPPPQVIERIIERVIERPTPPPEAAHDVTPPAPTPAPVLTSTAPPLHSVRGPKDWLVASPPEFLVEEHSEPRRIHIEESKPEPKPEPVSEPRHETHAETRHEHRPEVRREPKPEPRREPSRSHHEAETRPSPKRARQFLHRARRVVMRHVMRDNQPAEPGDRELLMMAGTLFGAVCIGLMIWGAYSVLPRPGAAYGSGYGGLRADAGSPKLKVVTGEYGPGHVDPRRRPQIEPPPVLTGLHPPPPTHAPPRPAPMPPLEHKKVPNVPPFTGSPLPETKTPVIPFERTLEALPRRVDPSIFVKANLGDTPMIRTWDNLAKYSMMLTALAAVPAMPTVPVIAQPTLQPVQQPQQPAVDYSKQIDALTQAVNRLTQDVTKLKEIDERIDAVRSDVSKQIAKIKIEPHDDSEIKLQLASIQKTLKFLLENPQAAPAPAAPGVAAAPAASANTSRIEAELVSIKDAILKLRPNDRVALSPPDLPTPALPSKTARVILVNLYDSDLWLWVNEKPHRVAKQTTFTLESVTPGTAKIEVKSQNETYHRISPTLVANETYTLTAR